MGFDSIQVAHSEELGVDTSRIGIMGEQQHILLDRMKDPVLRSSSYFNPMLDDRTVSAYEHLTPFLSWNTTDNETG
ncbi:lipase esterase [Fusarium coicis]|nr:lipase esterase [Fusarium coicis]